MRLIVAVLSLCLAGAVQADMPRWLLHEAFAVSEMLKDEARVACVQYNHWRPGSGICITMGQWCRMHRAMGEPVDNLLACRPPPVLRGRFGR